MAANHWVIQTGRAFLFVSVLSICFIYYASLLLCYQLKHVAQLVKECVGKGRGPGFDPRSQQISLFYFPLTDLAHHPLKSSPCTSIIQPQDLITCLINQIQRLHLPGTMVFHQEVSPLDHALAGLQLGGPRHFQQCTPSNCYTGPI